VPALRTLTVSSLAPKALPAGALMRALPVSLVLPALCVLLLAVAVQHVGLRAGRWFFVSRARHRQHLCCPVVS